MEKKRVAILLVSFLMLFSFYSSTIAGGYPTYQVKAGDTLWRISELYSVSLSDLKSINGLKNDIIQVGQKLKIPVSSNTKTVQKQKSSGIHYVVKKGDTLSNVALRYGTSVETLKLQNGLSSDLLQIGDVLVVSSDEVVYTLASRGSTVKSASLSSSKIAYTKKDYEWLAKIIEAEAENEPYEGKLAVGSVVINRVKSNNFPDTITEVIFQKTSKVYQFSPVGNGRIYKVKPSEDSIKAATAALKGEDPTEGALYFYNPTISKDKWIRGREVITVIGRHRFAL